MPLRAITCDEFGIGNRDELPIDKDTILFEKPVSRHNDNTFAE
jgi:hypothetical protein